MQHSLKGHVAYMGCYGNAYTSSVENHKKADLVKKLVVDGKTLKWVLE